MFYNKEKDARLNITLSKELYEKLKEEAERHHISIAAYVRASLARQVFGKRTVTMKGEGISGDYTVVDKDGAWIFDDSEIPHNGKGTHEIIDGNFVVDNSHLEKAAYGSKMPSKHIAKTKGELEHNIRAMVYMQVFNGNGWVDEALHKSRMRWLLESQIDNQSTENIYALYQELLSNGTLFKYKDKVFNQKKYAVLTDDGKGGTKTLYNTFIYLTERQLAEYERILEEDRKAEELEDAEMF